MTNPYTMSSDINPYQTSYNNLPQYNTYPGPSNKKTSSKSGPSTFGMMTLGALGGGAVGYFRNRYPVQKDGTVSDSFAKEVFEKNLKKNRSETAQKFFNQLNNVLKKIDKINSPEGLKKLLKENKEIIEEQCKGISVDTFLDGINSSNLKETQKSLKEVLEKNLDFEILKTKNAIKLGWNNDSKKFIKTPEFKDNKLFDVIKNTKNNIQWKKALKYGGITAGIMGALTIGYKFFTKN